MKKVCIVDDYEINLFVLREYLQNDYEVISFNNPIKCIEYLENNDVELVLMDCVMPEMDGYTATEIIKNKFPNTVVIGVTANPFEENINRCYLSGMKSVITKPIIKDELINIIYSFLDQK